MCAIGNDDAYRTAIAHPACLSHRTRNQSPQLHSSFSNFAANNRIKVVLGAHSH